MVAMRVVTSTGGNTLYYLHTDHLGSTSLSTCGSGGCGTAGALVPGSRQSYYPFGAVRTAASSLPTDITFTGQRKDASTGLMFYNARYYDPVIGRFVSADTIVPNAGNPQSFNRFSYVRNNPLNHIDPTGHREECEGPCPSSPSETNPYGIEFTSDEGVAWDPHDMNQVLNAAGAIARALTSVLQQANLIAHKIEGVARQRFSAAAVFQQTLGPVTFHRSANSCSPYTCWAATIGQVVTVYTSDNINTGIRNGQYTAQNATHELGHAFAHRTIGQLYGGKPYGDLESEWNVNPDFPRRGDNENGFAGGFPGWQQSGKNTANEEFADMFLGWSYNQWQDSSAGEARSKWMTTNMADWILFTIEQ